MKQLRNFALAAIGLALLTGCIRTTRVVVAQNGEGQEVDLVRRWHGLTIGPCGFVTGAYANYSIRLNGPGPIYSVDQIEFLNEKGELDQYAGKGLSGEVRVDLTRKFVTIDLQRGGYDFEINGRYRYRER